MESARAVVPDSRAGRGETLALARHHVSQSVISSALPAALSLSLMWHASEIIHLRGRVGGNARQHGRAACADCGDGTGAGALVGVALAISDRAAAQKAANSLSS